MINKNGLDIINRRYQGPELEEAFWFKLRPRGCSETVDREPGFESRHR